jgi:hypothetical protein
MRTAATTRAGIRVLTLSVGLAAMLDGAAPGVSAELNDPLSPLTSAGGSILCFGRDYSPDHLARHLKQMTKNVPAGLRRCRAHFAPGRAEADRRRLRLAQVSRN